MSLQHHRVITSPGAWIGREIQGDAAWIHHLDADTLEEIDAALARVKRTRARIPYSVDAFPLPRFRATLDAILHEIEDGRGFVLIRGIPRSRYTDEECELLYW